MCYFGLDHVPSQWLATVLFLLFWYFFFFLFLKWFWYLFSGNISPYNCISPIIPIAWHVEEREEKASFCLGLFEMKISLCKSWSFLFLVVVSRDVNLGCNVLIFSCYILCIIYTTNITTVKKLLSNGQGYL